MSVSINDLAGQAAELERLLKLRSIPFGMKLFETVEEMEAIPKIRRPKSVHTTDQIVAQAARLGWTVGITGDDLVGAQCRAVVGLGPQDAEWRSGKQMTGVWYATLEDAGAHQSAMTVVPAGRWRALAVAPLAAGRLGTTAVSRAELLRGVRTARQVRATAELLAAVVTLPLDEDGADRAAEVARGLDRAGQTIGMADALIAGIVLAHGGALLTRNRDHFVRVPGLDLAEAGDE